MNALQERCLITARLHQTSSFQSAAAAFAAATRPVPLHELAVSPREATKKSAGKKMPPVLQMLWVRRQASGLHSARLILVTLVDGSAPGRQDNASNWECTLTIRPAGLLRDARVREKPACCLCMLNLGFEDNYLMVESEAGSVLVFFLVRGQKYLTYSSVADHYPS